MKKIIALFVLLGFCISCEAMKDSISPQNNPNNRAAVSDTRLFTAAKKGDVQEIASILEENPESLNGVDSENGNTALHYAILEAHKAGGDVLGTVSLLILKGVDVNIPNKEGQTPLMLAAQIAGEYDLQTGREIAGDHDEVFKQLLRYGADANKVDKNGKKALHYATTTGTVAQRVIVQALAIVMPTVDDKDSDDKTPLDYLVDAKKNAPEFLSNDFPGMFRSLCARTHDNPYIDKDCKDYMPGTQSLSWFDSGIIYQAIPEEIASYFGSNPQKINGTDAVGSTPIDLMLGYFLLSDQDDRTDYYRSSLLLIDMGASIDNVLESFNFYLYFKDLDYDNSDKKVVNSLKQIEDLFTKILPRVSKEQINKLQSKHEVGEIAFDYIEKSYVSAPMLNFTVIPNTKFAYDMFTRLIETDKVDFNIADQNGRTALDSFLQYNTTSDSYYAQKLEILCENTKGITKDMYPVCESYL